MKLLLKRREAVEEEAEADDEEENKRMISTNSGKQTKRLLTVAVGKVVLRYCKKTKAS